MRRFLLFVFIAAVVPVAVPALGVEFRYCSAVRQNTCVLDGDTFRWRGATIRIENIDAPEMHDPGCAAEALLGFKAADRLIELLSADGWSLSRNPADTREVDRYGRKLRRIAVGGADVGEALVAEGLARPWNGKRRSWC